MDVFSRSISLAVGDAGRHGDPVAVAETALLILRPVGPDVRLAFQDIGRSDGAEFGQFDRGQRVAGGVTRMKPGFTVFIQ